MLTIIEPVLGYRFLPRLAPHSSVRSFTCLYVYPVFDAITSVQPLPLHIFCIVSLNDLQEEPLKELRTGGSGGTSGGFPGEISRKYLRELLKDSPKPLPV